MWSIFSVIKFPLFRVFWRFGFIFKPIKTYIPQRSGKHENNLKLPKTVLKKSFGSNADTEIGSWFQFPIPKPGFSCTLQEKKIFERKWANFALWNYIQQKVRFMSLCWFSIHELAWRTGDLERQQSCFAIFESSELVKVAKSKNIFSISSYIHNNKWSHC